MDDYNNYNKTAVIINNDFFTVEEAEYRGTYYVVGINNEEETLFDRIYGPDSLYMHAQKILADVEEYLEKGEVTDEFKNLKNIKDLVSDVWCAAEYNEGKVNQAIEAVTSSQYDQTYSSVESLLQDLEDETINIYQYEDETIAYCVLDWKTIGQDEDNIFAQYVLMTDCVSENDNDELYAVVELEEELYTHPEFKALIPKLGKCFKYNEDKHHIIVKGGKTRYEIIQQIIDLSEEIFVIDEKLDDTGTNVGRTPEGYSYSTWQVSLSRAFDWPEISEHFFEYIAGHEHLFKDSFASVRLSIISCHL